LALELRLWLALELRLWLALELRLWLELELQLWLELELRLWFELELRVWFERAFGRSALTCRRRLIVRRVSTARSRHHSIPFPSIFRGLGTVTRSSNPCREVIRGSAGASWEVRASLREIGAIAAWPSFDRADRGSRAAPIAMPKAPSAAAYIARIFLLSIGMSTCLSWGAIQRTTVG
jgi:hypothetical protein